MPAAAAIACAVAGLSPVSITTSMPSARRRAIASREVSRSPVRKRDQADAAAGARNGDDRLTRFEQGLRCVVRRRRRLFAQEGERAGERGLAVDRAARALAGHRRKSATGGIASPLALAARRSRRERMRRALLERGGDPQDVASRTLRSRRSRTAGLPSVSVPVLSTTSVTSRPPVRAPSVADEHAALRAAARADDDRRRRRKTERARTGDHQHGDRVDNAARGRRRTHVAANVATAIARRWARTHPTRGRPAAGSAPWSPGPRAPAGRCWRAASPRRCPSARNAAAVLIDRAGEDLGAGHLRHRTALAGQHAFVYRDAPLGDDAVDRNASPARTTKRSPARAPRAARRRPAVALDVRNPGLQLISPSIAADVPALARASSNLPSSTSVMTAAAASK